jgi:large subunit ribosomal protein LP1
VLALYDGGAEITSDQINTLLTATNNTVQPYWPTLFASNLSSGVAAVIANRGGGAPSVAAAAGPAGKIDSIFI